MNSDELYTLKSMMLDNYEQYHDGLRILLESDKGLYKAFGQSPRTKYLKTENFYLTSKERLTYMMGFIDAFAWLTRQGKLVPDTFPTDIAGFTDPEETPEERAEYFEKRYKGLSPEQRAELEAFDKENEEMWLEQVEESIKENKVINNLILRIVYRGGLLIYKKRLPYNATDAFIYILGKIFFLTLAIGQESAFF